MARGATHDERAGRTAARPGEIPRTGWWDILLRVKDETGRDNLTIIAGGVAYSAMLALFPALTALVSLYGLVFDPAEVERQAGAMRGVLPPDVVNLISEQLRGLAQGSQGALSVSFAISLLIALWSATAGVKAMMTSLNIIYGEEEKRGFIRFTLTALGLTLGAVLSIVMSMVLLAILPAVLKAVGLGFLAGLVAWARWPALALLVMVGLAVLYRYGPSRDEAKWRWVSWGAVIATLLWLAASAGLSFYVANFGKYNETYGSLGGAIVLLLWLYVSSLVVLIGAEINAETEHQTARDTTRGPDRPMGERGARMADTIGPRASKDKGGSIG